MFIRRQSVPICVGFSQEEASPESSDIESHDNADRYLLFTWILQTNPARLWICFNHRAQHFPPLRILSHWYPNDQEYGLHQWRGLEKAKVHHLLLNQRKLLSNAFTFEQLMNRVQHIKKVTDDEIAILPLNEGSVFIPINIKEFDVLKL